MPLKNNWWGARRQFRLSPQSPSRMKLWAGVMFLGTVAAEMSGASFITFRPDEILAAVASKSKYFEEWKMLQLSIPRQRSFTATYPSPDPEKNWDGVADRPQDTRELFVPILGNKHIPH
ncbi:MAG: uncharacterized protein A8A55_0943 [Amphiamblys sp. WSBS2006]|nr:MAG: uncharacterized protein A8A55_0943 [Amphiamblys sp. WSBS2006]